MATAPAEFNSVEKQYTYMTTNFKKIKFVGTKENMFGLLLNTSHIRTAQSYLHSRSTVHKTFSKLKERSA